MFTIGLTDHLEGPAEASSAAIYHEVADLVIRADELGVRYAWFAEHHAFAHAGHLPAPLLLALHLAGRTKSIRLGSAVICLNLHHPVEVAEQVAVADVLSGGRLAPGFGSGSTEDECRLFGVEASGEEKRHDGFERSLKRILQAWKGIEEGGKRLLPIPASDLAGRTWVAVNSMGAARIAGGVNCNVLLSHLRTVGQYREYLAAYRAAGGRGLVAANRPVFLAADDATAREQAEPALRILWRRFRDEGKISRETPEPENVMELCGHPINFIIGGPGRVADQLSELHRNFAFDVLNAELRWAGLPRELVFESLRLLMERVMPRVK